MNKNNKLVKVLLASSLLLPGLAPLASGVTSVSAATEVTANEVYYRVVTEEAVRFRTEENAKPVALVSRGDKVKFVKKVNTKWFEVEVDGETGYILRGNVTSEDNFTNEDTGIHKVAVKQEAGAEDSYAVAVSTALRTKDEDRYRPLLTLDRGETVKYLGTTVNNWFMVEVNGVEGYVKREDVTKHSNMENGQEADLSYDTYPEEQDPVLDLLEATITTALRTRPGSQYSALDEVARGAKVEYLGTVTPETDWFLVEVDGSTQGYIHRNHVTKVDRDEVEDLTVESVSAINSTTLEVTLSDGSTVMQTLDTPLEKNVPTEVTVKYDGEEYKFNVIWTPNTAEDLEGQIEDAKQAVKDLKEEQSEAKIAVQDANAKKKAAESALSYLEDLNLDEDNPRLVKAQEALDQAEAERVKANEELGKINKAVKEAEDDVTELEKELHQAKAIEAVEKAEETRTAEDIAAARKLVPNASGAELRAKLEGRLSDVEAINTAVVEAETAIKAIPAKITTNSNGLIGKARAAVKKATDLGATEDEIEGMDKLVAAEAKLAELQAEKKATDLVNNSVANFKAGNYDTAESQHDEALPLVNALTNKNLQKDLLAKLDTVKKGLEDIAAAAAVDELILAIHSSDHTLVTEEDREDVEAARAAFDNLTEDQQALVKHESHLKGLEGHLAKLEAASEVEALLLALPKADDVDYNDKDQIEKAREEYGKLEADVKAVVTLEAQNKLLDAEAALKVIEEMKATVATGVVEAGRFMEVQFDGFKLSDVKSFEVALFFGDTEQVSLTLKERLWIESPNTTVVTGNFEVLDENYWVREGKIGTGIKEPNVIKAVIKLSNGRTIELEETIKY